MSINELTIPIEYRKFYQRLCLFYRPLSIFSLIPMKAHKLKHFELLKNLIPKEPGLVLVIFVFCFHFMPLIGDPITIAAWI